MRFIALAVVALPAAAAASALADKVRNHGSADCASNHNPAIEVFEVDSETYILRQNKCVHFEAPFMYVLFGKHTVFVQDTGATANPDQFPLYDAVQSLIARRNSRGLKILVTHSHSHSDHTGADSQFRGKPEVTLVEPTSTAVRTYFGFENWPEGSSTIDLGGRVLEVIPAPGHQDEGIAVYDSRTHWLLTGDNVYPGRLYVKNWGEYRASIGRLVKFSKTRRVSAVLGAHIEMSNTGTLFPAGSTYQPHDRPKEIALAKFVVTPIGAFQRILGTVLKWLGVR